MASAPTGGALAEFERAFRAYAANSRRSAGDLLAQQAGLVAARATDYTPVPRNRLISFTPTGRRRSKHAGTYAALVVTRYFGRAARPLVAHEWRNASVREAIGERDSERLRVIFRKIGVYSGWPVLPWDVDLVYRAMNKRGQVRRQKEILTFGGIDRDADLERAIARTGKAKAGWATAMAQLGAKRLPSGGKVPAYITRHLGGAQGHIEDGRGEAHPYIRLVNTTTWARDTEDADRIQADATRGQAGAMTRAVEAYALKQIGATLARATRRPVVLSA